MPHLPLRTTAPRLLLVALLALLAGDAAAQTVWSGLTFPFTRPDNVDGRDLDYQDAISPDVRFARFGKSGLYNAASESGYIDGTSPEFTQWATSLNNEEGADISAENYAALEFTDFTSAYNHSIGNFILDNDAVVRLVSFTPSEDIYFDIHFTSWTTGHDSNQPGFAYTRGAPPVPPGNTGDYNSNGFVDAADYTIWRNTFGSMSDLRANGDDTGLSAGVIDQADYAFWKSRFGDVVPGPGGAGATGAVVPEPGLVASLSGVAALALAGARMRRFLAIC